MFFAEVVFARPGESAFRFVWNDPNPLLTGYTRVTGKAGKCTTFREYEEICPQGLPVSDLMKEAVSVFGE